MAFVNSCIAALFLSLFVACSVCNARCPPPEDMTPCSCNTSCTDCPAQMSCSDIHIAEELVTVFEKTKNYPFTDLVVENSSFMYLPSIGIEEKGFRKLHLRNNHMGKVFETAPSSKFLNEIHIKNTLFQRGIQWNVFSNLTELRRLVIVDTEIKRLPRKFGDDMPKSLKSIWLENTKISSIDNGALEKLVNLEILYIKKSNIRVLDRSILPRPSNIKSFMITYSKIQTLPEDLFSEMPGLKNIVLSSNLISKFQRSVFENILPQLSIFSLDSNLLRCNCDTRWVTEIPKFPHFFSAKCMVPVQLQGRRLDDLKTKDFRGCQ